MTDEETEGLFEACDIRKKKGMKFNEFIVLLCLVYLLQKPSPDQTVSLKVFLIILYFLIIYLFCLYYLKICDLEYPYFLHLLILILNQLCC